MEKINVDIEYIFERMEENEGDVIVKRENEEKSIPAEMLLYEFNLEDVQDINYIVDTKKIEIKLIDNCIIMVDML